MPPVLFVGNDAFALIRDADKPRVANDTRDQPDVGLFCSVEAEDTEGPAKWTGRKVRKAFAQDVTLGIGVELGFVHLPQAVLARNTFITCRRRFAALKQTLDKITVTCLVENVESIDQQPFVLGYGIGDRVDVRGVFSIVATFQPQSGIHLNGAGI